MVSGKPYRFLESPTILTGSLAASEMRPYYGPPFGGSESGQHSPCDTKIGTFRKKALRGRKLPILWKLVLSSCPKSWSRNVRFFSQSLLFLTLAICMAGLPSAMGQTTFNWSVNGGGSWNAPVNWGGGGFPDANDTARFTDIDNGILNPPVPSSVIAITSGQQVRNIAFLNGNATTAFTIGSTGQTLSIANNSLGTITRSGSANTAFATNLSVAGSNRDLLIDNANAAGSLSFQTIDVGATNIAEFAGTGTTNVATLTNGNQAIFSSGGTRSIGSLTNFNTVTIVAGTNTLTSISSANTINLNGGTNTIGSITGGVVNVNSGTNSISNVTSATVNLSSGLNSNITMGTGSVLNGTGTITGNVALNSGATYSPGNSPGTQFINGNLTFNNGSIFNWELDGNTTNTSNYDRIVFVGANRVLTVNPTVTNNLIFTNVDFSNSFWSVNQVWQVFSNVGILSGSLSNFNIVGGGAAPGTFQWQQSGSNINLLFSAAPASVPEPTSIALVGLATCLIGVRFRQKRRRQV
jgi:hypothetical protein